MLKKLLPSLLLIAMLPVTSFAKTVIFSKEAPAPIGIYSQAIEYDETVYLSGQIAIDPKTGELVKGDFKQQLKQALNNLSSVVKAADGELSDIVKVTIYLKDMHDYAMVNEVISEYFKQPYPARSVIGVKDLPKDATVEIEAIMAVKK